MHALLWILPLLSLLTLWVVSWRLEQQWRTVFTSGWQSMGVGGFFIFYRFSLSVAAVSGGVALQRLAG